MPRLKRSFSGSSAARQGSSSRSTRSGWGEAIIAAFELGTQRRFYYGLLRISDPASIRLNQDRPLKLAPDERREMAIMRSPAHLRQAKTAPAQDLPPLPLHPSCGEVMEQIGRRNSLPEARNLSLNCGRVREQEGA